jgi:hypothetical protein
MLNLILEAVIKVGLATAIHYARKTDNTINARSVRWSVEDINDEIRINRLQKRKRKGKR